jgi:hypothetical protein
MSPGQDAGGPTEEEMRAVYEAELSRITVTDMMAQAAVSLLNLAARKLAPAPAAGEPGAEVGAGGRGAAGGGGQDLEQVRDGIDGARALLDILERRIPDEVRPLRDALSQLQIAYAAAVRSGEGPSAGSAAGETGAQPRPATEQGPEGGEQPGPAQSSGRLWVPGS